MKRATRRDILKYGAATGLAAGLANLPGAARAEGKLKVGAVYVSPVSEIGWTKQHSLGIEAIRAEFGDNAEITVIDSIFRPQDAERVFRQLAGAGNDLIFGTSFSHGTPMQKVAPRFPKTAFEHCSGIKHLKNLGTFEAKYFEGTYVAGVAAGHVSKSAKIGFIGGFPIPDIVGPANALLRGAQSVNPDITCNVIFLNSWFDPGKEKEAAKTLIAQGCDVICSMTDTATGVQVAGENDAWSIGYASDMAPFGNGKHLTAFTLNWVPVYLQAARDTANGTWTSNERWLGLADDVIQMSPYNDDLPPEATAAAEKARAEIIAGTLHPFGGELKDQSGALRVETGQSLSDGGIRSIDWFVEGMIGKLG
ncbi:BMP family ABC transporter substrate-binding protein [Mameliella alba]|uniref:BMP family ABC transporter substrate-binding protein n=1 Tax=Mameliella alba TaxID=561184 RepID=UPI000B53418F|nr:BMP family ABC transporter substrate-binding protein [Mameliella alba]MBY6117809.1 BMP family ABC transporter substrate-binding protein [Mameliella alba]OWV44414.1 BMP family ABC transporter substrate-binding protein [Mameliella alba]OWV65176.1 BMP family ABC transporter substrate-binding protein [Mameliella alba]